MWEEAIPDQVLILTPDRVSDDCSEFELINETTITPGDCPQSYTIHVRWVANDSCGNFDVWEFDVEVHDVTSLHVVGWENNATFNPVENIDTSVSCEF
ncbi:MAG: hypothetical protein KIT69_08800 [Propionibacteriaceae bacterium]|nr:hypothetical protein [Propionibacteriaceae bacterium]